MRGSRLAWLMSEYLRDRADVLFARTTALRRDPRREPITRV